MRLITLLTDRFFMSIQGTSSAGRFEDKLKYFQGLTGVDARINQIRRSSLSQNSPVQPTNATPIRVTQEVGYKQLLKDLNHPSHAAVKKAVESLGEKVTYEKFQSPKGIRIMVVMPSLKLNEDGTFSNHKVRLILDQKGRLDIGGKFTDPISTPEIATGYLHDALDETLNLIDDAQTLEKIPLENDLFIVNLRDGSNYYEVRNDNGFEDTSFKFRLFYSKNNETGKIELKLKFSGPLVANQVYAPINGHTNITEILQNIARNINEKTEKRFLTAVTNLRVPVKQSPNGPLITVPSIKLNENGDFVEEQVQLSLKDGKLLGKGLAMPIDPARPLDSLNNILLERFYENNLDFVKTSLKNDINIKISDNNQSFSMGNVNFNLVYRLMDKKPVLGIYYGQPGNNSEGTFHQIYEGNFLPIGANENIRDVLARIRPPEGSIRIQTGIDTPEVVLKKSEMATTSSHPWEFLGLTEKFTEAEFKKALTQMRLKYAPDKLLSKPEIANAIFKNLEIIKEDCQRYLKVNSKKESSSPSVNQASKAQASKAAPLKKNQGVQDIDLPD